MFKIALLQQTLAQGRLALRYRTRRSRFRTIANQVIEPPNQKTGKRAKGISAVLSRNFVTKTMDRSDIKIG